MKNKLNILEAVRGGAALYVFLVHFMFMYFVDRSNPISILFSFGQEAVILFFLMSGFVIQYSNIRKRISFKTYFKRRFFRIYPLFIIAILMVFVNNIIQGIKIDYKTLFGNLLMLQDAAFFMKPGIIVDTFENSALWSLSYEWWFYMLFIPISKFKNKNQVAVVVIVLSAILYFIYPIQLFRWLTYFSIWWSGVILADLYVSKALNFQNILKKIMVPVLLFPTSIVIIRSLQEPFISIGFYPILEVRHFVSAIFFIIVAFIWFKNNWIGYIFFKPLESIAPFSYGIYVLHIPIITIFGSVIIDHLKFYLIQFTLITSLVLVITYFLEVKIQKKIINYFSR